MKPYKRDVNSVENDQYVGHVDHDRTTVNMKIAVI